MDIRRSQEDGSFEKEAIGLLNVADSAKTVKIKNHSYM